MPTKVSRMPVMKPAIHIAGAPNSAPALAMAPVSVAEGPSTDGSRLPQVAHVGEGRHAHQHRQAEIIAAVCAGV